MQASWQDPPEYRDPGGGGPQIAMPGLTPVVRWLLIANAVVFAVTLVVFLIFPSTWNVPGGFVPDTLGIQPALWRDWFPFVPVWQLLTWGFLHSVTSPGHILFNMLGLYFFGTMLEGILGGRRLMALWLTALVFSGLATLAVGLAAGSSIPTLGASGAVLAVIVAAATLRPNSRVIFILFPMTLRTLALILVGVDAFYMLLEIGGQGGGSNVAHLAHLSGAAWGFLLVKRGWIWRDPAQAVEGWREDRRVRREEESKEDVDRILEKIHREGISSLSSSEKSKLKRASKKP